MLSTASDIRFYFCIAARGLHGNWGHGKCMVTAEITIGMGTGLWLYHGDGSDLVFNCLSSGLRH